MTIANATADSSTPTTHRPHSNQTLVISLGLLTTSFLLTLYTYTSCPNPHKACTLPNDLILGLAVLLACLAAAGFCSSRDGVILFPLVIVCYFGVLGGLAWFGEENLRAGLAVILGVEVRVVAVFLGARICFWRRSELSGGVRDGDEEAARLVGGTEDGMARDADIVQAQVTPSEEKGDGGKDNGEKDVGAVAESENAVGS